MKPQRELPKKKLVRAFTLIELLVVISIIAVLAAILFPVFARARENARRASCISNAKQMALGMMQYSQDYDEKFPTVPYPVLAGEQTWDDAIFPYVKSDQVFICPSAYAENTRSYAMNAWIAGWSSYAFRDQPASERPRVISLAAIQSPANTVLLTEESEPKNALNRYNERGEGMASFNPGGVRWGTKSSAPWGDYTGLSRDASGEQRSGPGYGVHINDTFVTTFCDGHVKPIKSMRPPRDRSFLWSPD